MTQPPFGFGPGAGQGGSDDDGDGDDLAAKIPLFAELEKLMSWSGGPVNWDLARQVAISQLAGDEAKTGTPGSVDAEQVAEAVRLADLWLDEVADLPLRCADSRGVVAGSVGREDAADLGTPLRSRRGARRRGHERRPAGGDARTRRPAHVHHEHGWRDDVRLTGRPGARRLSTDVLNGTEIGLPLGPAGVAVLMPRAIEQFGAGISQPIDEVRLYLAAREAAHQRLFGHVPWLRQRLLDTVDAYARASPSTPRR
jgi:hypothetical protein